MRVAVVAFLVTLAFAPLVRSAMLRRGVIDVPNHRSSHAVPVARGGGLACVAGAAAGALVGAVTGGPLPWLAIGPCLLLTAIGFADDRSGLSPLPRLGAQILLGAIMGFALHGLLGAVVGSLLTAWVVNVVNFMDGINGITGLTMGLWGTVALAVGLSHGADFLSAIGAMTAGAALGFLPWNFPVARLFLGDAGSYLFGALAAAGLLTAWAAQASLPLVAAPLFLYAVDTSNALIRRARRGERLTEAHREHVYQQLTSGLGYQHWRVSVGVLLGSTAVSACWLMAWPLALVGTAAIGALYLSSPSLLAWRLAARSSAAGAPSV